MQANHYANIYICQGCQGLFRAVFYIAVMKVSLHI
jgi:hypothetical protein